jgi:hypothetical protein
MVDEFDLESWLKSVTKDEILSHSQIREGLNGKVNLHSGTSSSYVTKSYKNMLDGLIRFRREIEFIKHSEKLCNNMIPRMVAFDEANLIICQEFIEGKKSTPSSYMVHALLEFIQKINTDIKISDYPLMAANSMLEMEDLFNEIKLRIDEERINLSSTNIMYLDAIQENYEHLTNKSNELFNSYEFIKEYFNLMLSPSDVGPHNMLGTEAGFKFIDFEFAGVDSNIKLGFDLVAHPDLQFIDFVNKDIANRFLTIFGFNYSDMPQLLTTLFKLKWALLIIKKNRRNNSLLDHKQKLFITSSISNN